MFDGVCLLKSKMLSVLLADLSLVNLWGFDQKIGEEMFDPPAKEDIFKHRENLLPRSRIII